MRSPSRLSEVCAAVLLLACLLSAPPAAASVCQQNVTTTADSGPGSLRAAVAAASEGDGVCFDASLGGKTITITSAEIVFSLGLHFRSSGATVTISGGGAKRIFHVFGPSVSTMSNMVLRDGLAPDGEGGGGIYVESGASLTMTSCTMLSCVASGGGGAIRNSGALVLHQSTFAGNLATGAYGGAVDNVTGQLTVDRCTFTGNVASTGRGGAIDNYSTGAAIVSIQNSTIAYNSAALGGGGIHEDASAGSVTIGQSIVWGNTTGGSGPECDGTLTSADWNMFGNAGGCTIAGVTAHDNAGLDPLLGSLEWNGGPTKTMSLRPGSPAIDRITDGSCTLGLDQRGSQKPEDGDANGVNGCDVGAYEAMVPVVVTSLGDPGDSGTCTLRQAIASATTNVAQGTCVVPAFFPQLPARVTFGVNGTVHLGAELAPDASVMVDGPGADKLTLDAGGASRVFNLQTGTGAVAYVLGGLTVAHGGGVGFAAGLLFANAPSDTLAIDRCYFRDNVATEEAHISSSKVFAVDIARSTFSNASVSAAGTSGILLSDTDVTMTNCTLADAKTSYSSLTLTADGAGATASLRLTNTTVAGSEPVGIAAYEVGGAAAGAAAAILDGCIVSGHGSQFAGDGAVSRGHNVISDASGPAATNGDLKSTNPMLGSLAYNGGPMPTFNPKHGSPALDLIPLASLSTGLDQRGILRPLGAGADAGAVERYADADANGDGVIDVADVFYLINYLFASGPIPIGEADANGDGAVDVTDIFYIINNLFAGGPAPQ